MELEKKREKGVERELSKIEIPADYILERREKGEKGASGGKKEKEEEKILVDIFYLPYTHTHTYIYIYIMYVWQLQTCLEEHVRVRY